ncbi:MAG TPA: hypothetical protein VFX61_14610 [Micromonosporaceae bacterium]|nr:hypothetical protein [Micromonosporaceae bacterium]
MNMDYSAMWSVVDAHRRCADELEQTLRELTGDRPVPVGPDKIDLYSEIVDALWQARDAFNALADREGHTIRHLDSSRCRVFAGRCNRAIHELQKLGEL